MLASFLQSYCELSGPMLGLGHDGRGGGAVCGHGVGDLASCLSSWFRTQYSEMVGEEVVISDALVTHLARPGPADGDGGVGVASDPPSGDVGGAGCRA